MSPIHVETADIPSYVANKVMTSRLTTTGEVAEAVHLSGGFWRGGSLGGGGGFGGGSFGGGMGGGGGAGSRF